MDLTFETTDKEKSQVLLKVTVKQNEVKKEYDIQLKDAQKNAQIKGFRKGKVPVSVLETKFKQGFLAEAANKIIDSAYKEVIEKVEKKPIVYSMPKLENFELPELGKDFIFELIYDVYPEFKIGNLKTVEVEKNDVKITNDDINKELDKYIKEFSTIEPKDGKIEETDIALIDYTVIENGKEIFKKEKEHIHIGKNFDMYKLGNDIIGMKKDEEKEFEKTYGDEEIENLKGKTFKIKLKINEVKREKRPKLDDELAKEIDETCNTVDELKKKIKENLEKFSENSIKHKVLNQAMDKIIETFEGEIPDSMVDQQINMYYQDVLNRVGGDEKKAEQLLKLENLTKETYKEKMKDNALKDIKKGLVLQDIVKNEKIESSEEDIDNFVEPMAKQYKMDIDKFKKMYKDMGKYDLLKNEVETKKAYDFLYENVKIKKGKKISLEELFK